MKCPHCGKDIPQRLILADAARILVKKVDPESDNLSDAASRLGEWIDFFRAGGIADSNKLIHDLQEIKLLILKGENP